MVVVLWPVMNKTRLAWTRVTAYFRCAFVQLEQQSSESQHPTHMSTTTRPTRTYGKRHSIKYGPSSKTTSIPIATPEPSPTKVLSDARRPPKRRASSDEEESPQEQLSWLRKRRKSNGISKCKLWALSNLSLR